uniref:NADH-ubiquinone oxidoreductase chain 2 n=1 Tax=Phyllodactylus unctus TaxID=611294 RepID=K9JWX3_9SAUR|nr:NADH dehydrogenase subunit 2 [Phyllodactylus unctus]ADY86057.1 NADH dehydrogenase subunit 2 [Phyllodactylus unctus]
MNPAAWITLITGLSTGTIITMSSTHWMTAWLGLELNMLSILPLLNQQQHPRATEATTKYFLIQTTAATMILLTGTLVTWQTGQWSLNQPMNLPTSTLLLAALALKLGIAPLHLWYPDVIQGSTMTTALIISTWQKLAPLAFLYMTLPNLPTPMTLSLGLVSAWWGGWVGLNQTQTRKILAFSSIAHMGWLMTALTLNPHLTTLTLLTYITLTATMFTTLKTLSTKTLLDLSLVHTHAPTMQTLTLLTLLSLGGLPPLTGFMPKLLILKELTAAHLTTLSTLLLLASLPSLAFYIRMAYITTLTTSTPTTNTQHKWRHTTHTPSLLAPLMVLASLLLPLTPLLNTTT